MSDPPEPVTLLPVESFALTIALARVLRGEMPGPSAVATCVLALARVTGRHDWTSSDSDKKGASHGTDG